MKKYILMLIAVGALVSSTNAKTIYCKMEYEWWNAEGSAISCRAWNDTYENAPYPGILMTKVEGEDYIWSIEIDDNATHCMFVRCQGGVSEAVYFGSQTGKIQLPTDSKNLFVITNEEYTPHGLGQECEGYWTHYPPYNYYLIGWIENTDYMGDDYIFEEGSLLTTFTDTAYVAIKDQTGQTYMTEGWLGTDVTAATFYANPKQGDKLMVPGPSQVIFILYDNPDGSLDLEYEVISSGLQNTEAQHSQTYKQLKNGHLYIIHNDKSYTVLGTPTK